MSDSSESVRIARLLERLIRFQKLAVRTVESRMGISSGTLRRIFSGRIRLKYDHIIEILEILGISPRSFFKIAYEVEEPENLSNDELLSYLHKLALPEAAAPPPPALTRADLEAAVLETLEKLGLKPAASPPPGPRRPTKKPAR
jgi:transcriptional regulator with XRE-family HTH domain